MELGVPVRGARVRVVPFAVVGAGYVVDFVGRGRTLAVAPAEEWMLTGVVVGDEAEQPEGGDGVDGVVGGHGDDAVAEDGWCGVGSRGGIDISTWFRLI